jgi:hypothetical protein
MPAGIEGDYAYGANGNDDGSCDCHLGSRGHFNRRRRFVTKIFQHEGLAPSVC